MKAGNLGSTWRSLKKDGGTPEWASLANAKLWKEQDRWLLVRARLKGTLATPGARLQKAIDSEKGVLQVVTIECGKDGSEKPKTLTYGPLPAQLGGKRIDCVWVEVKPFKVNEDGSQTLPEGMSLISEFQKVNEGEVSFIFFGTQKDVLDVLPVAQRHFEIVYPHYDCVAVFCRDDVPFPREPKEKNRREQQFCCAIASPRPLKMHRLHACMDMPFRMSVITWAIDLLDIPNDGAYRHLLYAPMDREWDALESRLAYLLAYLPNWQVSLAVNPKKKVQDAALRSKIQSKVTAYLAQGTVQHEREMLLLSRGEQLTPHSIQPQKDAAQLKEEHKQFLRATEEVARQELVQERAQKSGENVVSSPVEASKLEVLAGRQAVIKITGGKASYQASSQASSIAPPAATTAPTPPRKTPKGTKPKQAATPKQKEAEAARQAAEAERETEVRASRTTKRKREESEAAAKAADNKAQKSKPAAKKAPTGFASLPMA